MVKTCVRWTNAFNCTLGLFHVVACLQLNFLHSSFSCDFHIFIVIVDVTIFCRRVYSFSLSLEIIVYICLSKVETKSSHEAYKCQFFFFIANSVIMKFLNFCTTKELNAFHTFEKKKWCWKRSFAVFYPLSVWMSWYVFVWASVWSVVKDNR